MPGKIELPPKDNRPETQACEGRREMHCYVRPGTVGELIEKLKEGIECEVVEHAKDMTLAKIMWIEDFVFCSTRKSENKGWCVFYT